MASYLFVCMGNICRSPIAEGVARHIAKQEGLDITIDSAGTESWHTGKPPCPNSIKVAALNGVDISGLRARQVTTEDFTTFDYVIALDETNMRDLKAIGGSALKLGDFGCDGQDVPDPYYFEEFEDYHDVYNMIEKCVIQALKELK